MQHFDHYCPWVGNAIGKKNRHLFIMFVILLLIPLVMAYIIAFCRIQQTDAFMVRPWRAQSVLHSDMLWTVGWMVCNSPLLLTLAGLAFSQLHQVSNSGSFLAEILVKSPWKLFIVIILKKTSLDQSI